MQAPLLLETFLHFGLAALLGFLIGLERGMLAGGQPQRGLRDFVLIALLGAVSAFMARELGTFWIVIAGFLGALVLLSFGLWETYAHQREQDKGITTEIAALLTFFLGVLVIEGMMVLAIALTIVILAVLTEKEALHALQRRIQRFELEAVLKLLVITFIVLPLLPRVPLSRYLVMPLGTVAEGEEAPAEMTIALKHDQYFEPGQTLLLRDDGGRDVGPVQVTASAGKRLTVSWSAAARLPAGSAVGLVLDLPVLSTLLEAIVPYTVWLLVVLVATISFIGYAAVKLLGSTAGIPLTGIVGGLASSTVTTLSFARRSRETPAGQRAFAVAVILASSVMFPRLLVQISVVNLTLMRHLLVPILAMAGAGLLGAVIAARHGPLTTTDGERLRLENPFRFKVALTFALVLTATLMVTHLALAYLGQGWLPLVSLISGLSDADAVAFSMSEAAGAGRISVDWAGVNVVLGTLANTVTKLLLALTLGHRGLFRRLVPAFAMIVVTGLLTMTWYYGLLR